MKNPLLKIYVKYDDVREVLKNEEGQDLIEYALVIALIAFAAVVGMQGLATGINTAFTNISTKLGASIT